MQRIMFHCINGDSLHCVQAAGTDTDCSPFSHIVWVFPYPDIGAKIRYTDFQISTTLLLMSILFYISFVTYLHYFCKYSSSKIGRKVKNVKKLWLFGKCESCGEKFQLQYRSKSAMSRSPVVCMFLSTL